MNDRPSPSTVQLWDCSVIILLQPPCHFLSCQTPPKRKTVFIALHKSAPLTSMHRRCVTVNQTFDWNKYCMVFWRWLLEYTCAFFLSTDTNMFCISLSFPFLCHLFLTFIFLVFLTYPSRLVCFHSVVSILASSLPHYHLCLCVCPLHPNSCTFWPCSPFEPSSFLTPALPRPVLPTLLPPHRYPFLSPRLLLLPPPCRSQAPQSCRPRAHRHTQKHTVDSCCPLSLYPQRWIELCYKLWV